MKRRFFHIDFQDRPTKLVLNSLLKNLEEPIAKTTIIITAPSEKYLIPTILSRALRIDFSPLTTQETIDRLINEIQCSQSEAKQIAVYAGGLDMVNGMENFKEDLINPINKIIQTCDQQGLCSYKDIYELASLVTTHPFGYKVCMEYLSRALIKKELTGEKTVLFENFEDGEKDKFGAFMKTLIENSAQMFRNNKINRGLKLETEFMSI